MFQDDFLHKPLTLSVVLCLAACSKSWFSANESLYELMRVAQIQPNNKCLACKPKTVSQRRLEIFIYSYFHFTESFNLMLSQFIMAVIHINSHFCFFLLSQFFILSLKTEKDLTQHCFGNTHCNKMKPQKYKSQKYFKKYKRNIQYYNQFFIALHICMPAAPLLNVCPCLVPDSQCSPLSVILISKFHIL